MKYKTGDTLIEVTLAVGIFSLVAIAVVAVVNGSTSGAQTSLEITLAREEIDTQAEALRFIQSSYINSNTIDKTEDAIPEAEQKKYKKLWEMIKSYAITTPVDMRFQPSTCQSLYDAQDGSGENVIRQEKAFVVNPRNLGISVDGVSDTWVNDVLVSASQSSGMPRPDLFQEASTYPRIIYGTSDAQALVEGGNLPSQIFRIEGLYITAVAGPQTTIVLDNGTTNKVEAAYLDFYIRSCWYGPGANTPSTISTVMRLYNPDVVKLNNPPQN